jgi:hypothetical protein
MKCERSSRLAPLASSAAHPPHDLLRTTLPYYAKGCDGCVDCHCLYPCCEGWTPGQRQSHVSVSHFHTQAHKQAEQGKHTYAPRLDHPHG